MKTKRVKLDKQTILEFLCRMFQAERAVAGLSEFHWPHVLRYYDEHRVNELINAIENVRRFLPEQMQATAHANPPVQFREDYWSWRRRVCVGLVVPFYDVLWPHVNRLRSRWSFTVEELRYMLNRVETFLQILRMPAFPGYEFIISLRMELTACRSIIEGRCHGLRELKEIFFIEYYNKAPSLKTIPLAEILHRAKRAAA